MKADTHCYAEGCTKPIWIKRLCSAHYKRLYRNGTLELRRPISKWSRAFDACIRCGKSEHKHTGKGICRLCRSQIGEEKHRVTLRASRRRKVVARHGLTIEQYDAMWDAQDGRCAICQGRASAKLVNKGKSLQHSLHIDHDHAMNVVRGLLCSPCNRGLGQFRDNPDTLIAAAAYIRAHRSEAVEGTKEVLN